MKCLRWQKSGNNNKLRVSLQSDGFQLDENSKSRFQLRFALSLIALLAFVGAYEFATHLPATGNTPKVGQAAPTFTLPDVQGKAVSFSDLIATPATGLSGSARTPKAVLVVFYRGYW
jgi:hypothetical protein